MRALLTSEFLQGIMLSTHDLHNLDCNPQPFHISTLQTEVVKIEHMYQTLNSAFQHISICTIKGQGFTLKLA